MSVVFVADGTPEGRGLKKPKRDSSASKSHTRVPGGNPKSMVSGRNRYRDVSLRMTAKLRVYAALFAQDAEE